MNSFTAHKGLVLPLDGANVDTDQIVPKQYLKAVGRKGFGEVLFDSWRYVDSGELGQDHSQRRLNRDFVLNFERYRGASILLARANFGCGSSREHAVWALQQAGFCAIVAPSFADIFHTNCYHNGLLAVVLKTSEIDTLFQRALTSEGYSVHISLPEQTVRDYDSEWRFEISSFRKRCLLEGLSQIDLTLCNAEKIRAYEKARAKTCPWLF